MSGNTDNVSSAASGLSVRERLRSHMPVAEEFAYFDHAAVAPLPDVCRAAIADYALAACQQGDVPWPSWSAGLAELRQTAAEFLRAKSEEIALVPNTTHGIGLVAEGFPWESGDNVVVPANEFPSNMLPWKALERRGVELRRVAVDADGTLNLERLAAAMDARTRIVSLSWVGFASGYRVDVAEVAELVHARGGLLFLDAIQGLGVFPLDVRAAGVDFLAADGHKWMLGPEGAGLLYIAGEHLNRLQPLGLGWNSLESGGFDPASSKIKSTAGRYEGGTMNMPGMLGFGASLRLLHGLQSDNAGAAGARTAVAEAVLDNVAQLEQLLRQADFQVHVPAERRRRSGIVGIAWESAQADGDSAYLAARKHCLRHGVVLSVRGGRLRASTHAYNNEADFQRLVDALREFRQQQSV